MQLLFQIDNLVTSYKKRLPVHVWTYNWKKQSVCYTPWLILRESFPHIDKPLWEHWGFCNTRRISLVPLLEVFVVSRR